MRQAGGPPVLAYLCPRAWRDLAAWPGLEAVAVEAQSWQSADLTARLPSAPAAIEAALAWARARQGRLRGAGGVGGEEEEEGVLGGGGGCSGAKGATAFAAFFNHPDEGIFIPSWPVGAVALSAPGGLGRLPPAREAEARALLGGLRPGLGPGLARLAGEGGFVLFFSRGKGLGCVCMC